MFEIACWTIAAIYIGLKVWIRYDRWREMSAPYRDGERRARAEYEAALAKAEEQRRAYEQSLAQTKMPDSA